MTDILIDIAAAVQAIGGLFILPIALVILILCGVAVGMWLKKGKCPQENGDMDV